jgi:hypothetical protein
MHSWQEKDGQQLELIAASFSHSTRELPDLLV